MLLAQILSVSIFVVMFILIILEIFERQWTTLVCGALTLILVFGLGMHSAEAALKTLNVENIFTLGFWYAAEGGEGESSGINWATIIFITGMMIMVEGMARVGFFRWLCMLLAKTVKYKVIPIFVTFMLMSGILAMFIDSITVILFLAAVTVELSQLLKFNPVPMVLAEVFCANLGGSATMCGDPPNIIIGTSFGYSFADFVCNTGVIAGISLIFILVFFFFSYRKELSTSETVDTSAFPTPESAITDKKGFVVSSVIFAIAVLMLVTHAQTHLSVATIGLFISIITLLTAPRHIKEIMSKVDYKTVLFFLGLFVVVGGLEQTEILKLIAGFIQSISGGNPYIMIAIIIWVSAMASAFVDNIPFAATMIPVIAGIAASLNIDATPLYFGLLTGATLGGNCTPVGASANITGIGILKKAGYTVKNADFFKIGIPFTIAAIVPSYIYIWLMYGI